MITKLYFIHGRSQHTAAFHRWTQRRQYSLCVMRSTVDDLFSHCPQHTAANLLN